MGIYRIFKGVLKSQLMFLTNAIGLGFEVQSKHGIWAGWVLIKFKPIKI